jgi:hypothetical protein
LRENRVASMIDEPTEVGSVLRFSRGTESRRLEPRDNFSSSNLTLAVPFSPEASQRSGRIALQKMRQKFARSYKIEEGTIVLSRVIPAALAFDSAGLRKQALV